MFGGGALPQDDGTDDAVLTRLRSATSAEHQRVENTLDLMNPGLTRRRLTAVMSLMHGFWVAAEEGLDRWAGREPSAAGVLEWHRRRRAHLFAGDLVLLGHPASSPAGPELPQVADTDEAMGRLYVLEGSALGGTFIDRHLATLPELSGGVRLRAFSPYGANPGPMWQTFRRAVRTHVEDGGNAERVVGAACATFSALADWCEPVREQASA